MWMFDSKDAATDLSRMPVNPHCRTELNTHFMPGILQHNKSNIQAKCFCSVSLAFFTVVVDLRSAVVQAAAKSRDTL